jgi:hypothetical protein
VAESELTVLYLAIAAFSAKLFGGFDNQENAAHAWMVRR